MTQRCSSSLHIHHNKNNRFATISEKYCGDETENPYRNYRAILSCHSTARPFTHISDKQENDNTENRKCLPGRKKEIYFFSSYDCVTLWDRPLYLVTTAELTQSGSSKSTLKLLLLLTDRRTALGGSGGPEGADRRRDGETGERSAGREGSRADSAR